MPAKSKAQHGFAAMSRTPKGRAKLSPQLAAQLAQQEGIDWQPDGEKPSGSVH